MGSLGKTVVLSGLIENGNAEAFTELFAKKRASVCASVCVCIGSAVRCKMGKRRSDWSVSHGRWR